MANLKKCPKCGEMKDTRGFDVHYKNCDGKLEENENQVEVIVDQKESITQCYSCKSDKIMRLDEFIEKFKEMNPKISVNESKLKQIYKDGYTHICGMCGEVLK